MNIKRDKYDKVFSDMIRARDRYRCRACGAVGRTEAAHVYSRIHRSIRLDPRNAMALCHGHHRYYTREWEAWGQFVNAELGAEVLDILRTKKMQPVKRSKGDKEALYKYLKMQKKRCEEWHELGSDKNLVIPPFD